MISLREQAAAAGLKYAGDLENLVAVSAMVQGRTGPTVVVHGHLHIGHTEAFGSILHVSCAALIEPPFEATVLDVARYGARFTVRCRSAPVAPVPNVPLPVLSPSDQTWVYAAGVWRRTAADLRECSETADVRPVVAG